MSTVLKIKIPLEGMIPPLSSVAYWALVGVFYRDNSSFFSINADNTCETFNNTRSWLGLNELILKVWS